MTRSARRSATPNWWSSRHERRPRRLGGRDRPQRRAEAFALPRLGTASALARPALGTAVCGFALQRWQPRRGTAARRKGAEPGRPAALCGRGPQHRLARGRWRTGAVPGWRHVARPALRRACAGRAAGRAAAGGRVGPPARVAPRAVDLHPRARPRLGLRARPGGLLRRRRAGAPPGPGRCRRLRRHPGGRRRARVVPPPACRGLADRAHRRTDDAARPGHHHRARLVEARRTCRPGLRPGGRALRAHPRPAVAGRSPSQPAACQRAVGRARVVRRGAVVVAGRRGRAGLAALALWARSARRCLWKCPDQPALAWAYAAHSHLQQLPILAGQWRWWRLQRARRAPVLIEYKAAGAARRGVGR